MLIIYYFVEAFFYSSSVESGEYRDVRLFVINAR